MNTVFKATLGFLDNAVTELEKARLACATLAEQLARQLLAVQYSLIMSGWVTAKANDIQEGANNLALTLETCQSE